MKMKRLILTCLVLLGACAAFAQETTRDEYQARYERLVRNLGYDGVGIETVLDLIDFDRLLSGVDLVVTGEGRTDRQSCFGKVMQGVGERAAKAGVKAVGLSGSAGEGYEEIFDHGISSLTLTMKEGLSLKEAMENAEQLYAEAAEKMFLGSRTEQAGILK